MFSFYLQNKSMHKMNTEMCIRIGEWNISLVHLTFMTGRFMSYFFHFNDKLLGANSAGSAPASI